jgi:5-methyltetrahydropteroyltriglutamate--homocysteine methyltransferase
VKIETTLAGSYPKLPTSPGDINLRVVKNRRDQGKATDDDVRDATRQTTRRILDIQDRAGIDLPVDGSAGWDDAQTYVARGLGGFQIAGLIRYLDTNTYYRQPEITGAITWKGPVTVEDFRAAQSMSERPVKALLPGPYSLYRFSKDRHYKNEEEALAALGTALAQESAALEEAGARWIHFEEPWLGRAKADEANKVRAALTPLFQGRKAKTTIHVPFAAPVQVFDVLRDLPWTAIGLDLREAPGGWDLLSRVPEGRTVALGLLDARNTKLEEVDEVARDIARARSARPDLTYQLSTTASLEYLPADKAELKVTRLVEAARAASRNGGS